MIPLESSCTVLGLGEEEGGLSNQSDVLRLTETKTSATFDARTSVSVTVYVVVR